MGALSEPGGSRASGFGGGPPCDKSKERLDQPETGASMFILFCLPSRARQLQLGQPEGGGMSPPGRTLGKEGLGSQDCSLEEAEAVMNQLGGGWEMMGTGTQLGEKSWPGMEGRAKQEIQTAEASGLDECLGNNPPPTPTPVEVVRLLNNWVILGKVFNLSCLRFYTHEVEVRKGPPLEIPGLLLLHSEGPHLCLDGARDLGCTGLPGGNSPQAAQKTRCTRSPPTDVGLGDREVTFLRGLGSIGNCPDSPGRLRRQGQQQPPRAAFVTAAAAGEDWSVPDCRAHHCLPRENWNFRRGCSSCHDTPSAVLMPLCHQLALPPLSWLTPLLSVWMKDHGSTREAS
nr:PREDICTED: uncharacterized protein LOC106700636 [Bos mutus]